MRQYEMMVIAHPELVDEGLTKTIETIGEWITASEGKVVKIDNWGRRKFAYPIDKLRDGNYILFDVELEPTAIVELERNLRLSEDVLRYLLVRLED